VNASNKYRLKSRSQIDEENEETDEEGRASNFRRIKLDPNDVVSQNTHRSNTNTSEPAILSNLFHKVSGKEIIIPNEMVTRLGKNSENQAHGSHDGSNRETNSQHFQANSKLNAEKEIKETEKTGVYDLPPLGSSRDAAFQVTSTYEQHTQTEPKFQMPKKKVVVSLATPNTETQASSRLSFLEHLTNESEVRSKENLLEPDSQAEQRKKKKKNKSRSSSRQTKDQDSPV
jgi:hypothetical protein